MPLSTSDIEDAFTSKEEAIKGLLSSILNASLPYETNEKHIITIINKLLSTAVHCREGLEYLNVVIANCSHSVIAENAINWISHCIIKFAGDVLRELKLRVAGEIIEVAHNETEFNKKFVSDYISKILDNCTTTSHVNPYECKAALKTLTTSMRHYPSWFGAHRHKIENFLLIFLDSENADLVQSTALAFHYLQQVGSAGVNGANHKLNFTHNFHKLCRTVHDLFDILFESEKEIFHTAKSNDDNVFKFHGDPSSNTQVPLNINAKRIRNVLIFIEAMIKTKFPVAKETQPKKLLEVITRGTSFHKCFSGDSIESLETYKFSFLLSEIQCSVVKLLRLFIIWYQTNCLPFSYMISKVLVDNIERSHNCECFKYDSLYQESSYRALSEWLSISRSSLHPQFQSQILVCILKDITPVKSQITLTISEAASGKKSQKAKRKAMANRIISSGNQPLTNDSSTHYEKNNERNTCKFALAALRHLLELTRLNVKPALLKDLYKSIFDSLMSVQSSKPVHPYTDAQCQAKLYEVLVAVYHQNTLSVLPPLQTSLEILNRGANDSNRLVAEICQIGLRNLEILCQPICPSLYLGVDKGEEEMDEAQPVREKIVIEEMVVDEEGNDDEALSVDYDASTDEFPQNESARRDSGSNSLSPAYLVILPDTDPSIDDGLSDKGVDNGEVGFEELDVATKGVGTREDEQVEISISPMVTIQNEDENEVVESENREAFEGIEEEDKIQPSCSYTSQQEENMEHCTKEILEDQEDLGDIIRHEEITETEENYENEDAKEPAEESASRESSNKLVEPACLKPKEIENGEPKSAVAKPNKEHGEQQISTSETGIKKRVQDEADSKNLKADSEEPPAKKAEIISKDLGTGEVFDEVERQEEEKKEGADSDSRSFDDCFVDEVQDYY